MATEQRTVVLEVAGVHWASEKTVIERVLVRRPGVLGVGANPVGQTATVTYDPTRTSVADLAAWIRDCGYHCAGQSVPRHACDPAVEPHVYDWTGLHYGYQPAEAGGVAMHEHSTPAATRRSTAVTPG
jgi:Cu2+-exporting ATPase